MVRCSAGAGRDVAGFVQYPVSMFGLIPLKTLPGWPEAADPTAIQTLTVLLGIPAAIALVLLLLVMAPSWFHPGRRSDDPVVRKDS